MLQKKRTPSVSPRSSCFFHCLHLLKRPEPLLPSSHALHPPRLSHRDDRDTKRDTGWTNRCPRPQGSGVHAPAAVREKDEQKLNG